MGSPGFGGWSSSIFPTRFSIVDWFHACEYLSDVARMAFSEAKKRQNWLTTARSALWNGELDEVIKACRRDVQPARDPADDLPKRR
jgi:hypothetical protein